MSTLSHIQDLGVDPLLAGDLMGTLEIYPEALGIPEVFHKFKDVLEYVQKVPDKGSFVNRILIGKNVNKLDHLWGYVNLNKQLDDATKKAQSLKDELNFYEK